MSGDEAVRARLREARQEGSLSAELVRVWAELARRGDVSTVRAVVEGVMDRAAAEPISVGGVVDPGDVVDPREDPKRGALEISDIAWLLRSAVVWKAASRVGDSLGANDRAGSRRRGHAPGGHAVVGLAVLHGSLVTFGAKRGNQSDWHYAAWMKPGHAWAELGAWTRKPGGEFTAPCAARLAAWARVEAADRITMDLGTARALALEIFSEPFDRSDDKREARA